MVGQRHINFVWAALQEAVVNRQRAPVYKGGNNAAYGELARMGRIKIEISGRNWRTVTLLTGAHAGKRTLSNPAGHKVYLVVDELGVRRLAGDQQYVDKANAEGKA